jgi:hypothetical protein
MSKSHNQVVPQWQRKSCKTYQGAVSHELGEVLVLSLVYLLFQDTKGHGLFDDLIIIRNIALIYAALKQPRWVMATVKRRKSAKSKRRGHSSIC